MNDSQVVTVPDGINQRHGTHASIGFAKLFDLEDLVKQLAALHELHYQTVMSLVLKYID